MGKIKESTMSLKHEFSNLEIMDFTKKLARVLVEMQATELDKKSSMSHFTSKIDGQKLEIQDLSNRINNGYEYRNTGIIIEYNTPAAGRKTIYRKDLGSIVGVYDMDSREMQEDLDFGDTEKSAEPEAKKPHPVLTHVKKSNTEDANFEIVEPDPKPEPEPEPDKAAGMPLNWDDDTDKTT